MSIKISYAAACRRVCAMTCIGFTVISCGAELQDDESIESEEQALQAGDVSAWAYYDGFSIIANNSFNSTGGFNTATRSAIGKYSIRLAGIYGAGGNVQVSAVGNLHCKTLGWGPTFPVFDDTVSIRVGCSNPAGTPADSGFVVSFARFPGGTTPSASGAYVWMNQAAGGTLDPAYQWGASASATHPGTGQYQVQLSGQPTLLGDHVQVTAHGDPGAQYCKVGSWYGDGHGHVNIDVHCHGPGGALVDSKFSLRYYRDTRDSRNGSGGYAWVSGGVASPYYRRNKVFSSEGAEFSYPVNAQWGWTGVYTVDYPMQFNPYGIPLVTAQSTNAVNASYCNPIVWWTLAGGTIRNAVDCFDAAGELADGQFFQLYLSP